MSDLNEMFAELKNEIGERITSRDGRYDSALDFLYGLDKEINNGEFARAEQDAYIG